MGRNKAVVRLGSLTLLDRVAGRLAGQVASIAVNCSDPSIVPAGFACLPDPLPGKPGPLAGILAALLYAEERCPAATHVATVPVDSPFFPRNIVSGLTLAVNGTGRIAVARSGGRIHPIFALWPLTHATILQAWLAGENSRRVLDLLQPHNPVVVDFPLIETTRGQLDPFFNINTSEDLEEAERWLRVFPGSS